LIVDVLIIDPDGQPHNNDPLDDQENLYEPGNARPVTPGNPDHSSPSVPSMVRAVMSKCWNTTAQSLVLADRHQNLIIPCTFALSFQTTPEPVSVSWKKHRLCLIDKTRPATSVLIHSPGENKSLTAGMTNLRNWVTASSLTVCRAGSSGCTETAIDMRQTRTAFVPYAL